MNLWIGFISRRKNKPQFLYAIAMINHGLDQKYSEERDVREVQLEGAKLFLEFLPTKSIFLILEGTDKNSCYNSCFFMASRAYEHYETMVMLRGAF